MRAPALLLVLALLLPAASLRAADAPDYGPVKKWIARQDEFTSVVADFTQTRALKALRSPLASPGRLWFSAPGSFRWELGNPAKTIVLRKGETMYIIQPAKKRAERSSTTSPSSGKPSGAQGFGMMTMPLAKDFADFQRQFETLSITTEGTRCHLEVLPREAQARKFLSAIKLDFSTVNGHMLALEIATREGSSMRNEFSNVQVNTKIDRSVFEYDFTGYEIVDAKP